MTSPDDHRPSVSTHVAAGARQRLMEVVPELRPELHRYCARMTGSVFDGEDVVQDALAKAHDALGRMTELPPIRPWLFRIAHNTALDFLRRYERKNVDVVADVPEMGGPDAGGVDEAGVDPALVEAALGVFVDLPPAQRSALILKDVLGQSLAEVAATLGMSVAAVKASLWRAREHVASRTTHAPPARVVSAIERANLQRYVDLFNDRDWPALRALLSEQTRLDLVSRLERTAAEAQYFERYAEALETENIRAEAGLVDGVHAIAMFRAPSCARPSYFVLLAWENDRVTAIRDFRYVPYIGSNAQFAPLTRRAVGER